MAVYVNKEFRKKGFLRKLMEYMENYAKSTLHW